MYTLLPSKNEVRKDQASTLVTKIDKVNIRQILPGVSEPDRFNHFSSFNCLKRCIVRLQRAIEKVRPKDGPPLVAELSQAECVILKSLQHHHFESETKILSNLDSNEDQFEDRQKARNRNNTVKLSSNLHKLDPFVHKDGLLRVGGCLKSSASPFEIKHPLILPKNSYVTVLLIRQFHHNPRDL